jgi:transcriptional regulator with XRE-family HTH domain
MYEKISEKVLEQIRILKNEKGLSDEELSKKTNIHLPFLSSLMKGNRNNASLDTLVKLTDALDTTLLDLLKSLNIN